MPRSVTKAAIISVSDLRDGAIKLSAGRKQHRLVRAFDADNFTGSDAHGPGTDRAAAELLVKARRGGTGCLARLPAACRPSTVADAHAVQDAVTKLLREPVGAFKAAAPANDEAWRG